MTRQTWTATVSAGLFVALAAVLALTPVNFVAWAPGQTYDVLGAVDGKPIIQISGVATYPVTGQLRLTTVSVTRADSRLSLPGAMLDYLLPNHHVLPREAVYPVGQTPAQATQEGTAQMTASQQGATVAALRAAGVAVQENPVVSSVVVGGPSYQVVKVGDIIETVDNLSVATRTDVVNAVHKHKVGDTVILGVDRDGLKMQLQLVTGPSADDRTVPQIGLTLSSAFRYLPKVTFNLDPAVQGPSGGLIFALGIYDLLSQNDLADGRIVAGTGQIDASGAVSAISGVQEKLRAAQEVNAQYFLLPAANCADVMGLRTRVSVVKVTSLEDAISSLERLDADPGATVPRC